MTERSWKHLGLERSGGVVTCTLANPPTHTLTASGVTELGELVENLEGDASVRVVVFTGADPDIFIRHYEVGELSASSDRAVAAAHSDANTEPNTDANTVGSAEADAPELHAFHQLCLRLEAMDAITVAAINGFAAGGGCEFTLACDFRLMSDSVPGYGLPETSVGILPGGGGTQRFARLLGTARALDLILHAKLLSATEALESGLVHRLYPADRFAKEVEAFAADLAARAPIALAAAKRAVQVGSRLPLEQGLALEQDCFGRTMRSKDASAAMKAFLAGERYEWKGE